MMEMEGRYKELLDKGLAAYTEREQRWWKQDRRGRWVVLEPGPGRLLTGSPRHIRDRVDLVEPIQLALARPGVRTRDWRRSSPMETAGARARAVAARDQSVGAGHA